MQLVIPSIKYQESYFSYIKELGDEERYPFPLDFEYSDFPKLINKLEDYANGINLPKGYVTSSTLWLIVENDIAGVCNIRHFLNDDIRECGGHIGLGVRPSFRRKGLGEKLMQMAIQKLLQMGEEVIHIHCYADNKSSASIIKKNGGLLDSEITVNNKVVQRFLVKI